MKKYITYYIRTAPFNPEIISNALWKFDLPGLVEDEAHVEIFLPGNTQITETEIENELEKLKTENLIKSFSIKKEIIEDKNWNELWEKSREVIRVSAKIIIKPSFKDYTAKKGEIVLTIDPKMSFGTGEHQTTKLVLRLLEKFIVPGMKILDVGAGTGILSISAVKLGAASAIAIDTDKICYENCKENCELNGVPESVKILNGEIKDVQKNDFDLIIANINKNVLLEIVGEIKTRLKENKNVILSGLLEDDFNIIVSLYSQKGFKLIEKLVMDEWIALVLSEHG
jgi:ribosomal protein L11 methyltransferase